MKKLIASFIAVATQAFSGVDTVVQVVFGEAKESAQSIFSMSVEGAMTVLASIGRVEVESILMVGGVSTTNTGKFIGRMLLNGEQVGDSVAVTVTGTGNYAPLKLSNTFSELTSSDVITVEVIADATGTTTTGSLVLVDGTSDAAAWTSVAPAVINVYG